MSKLNGSMLAVMSSFAALFTIAISSEVSWGAALPATVSQGTLLKLDANSNLFSLNPTLKNNCPTQRSNTAIAIPENTKSLLLSSLIEGQTVFGVIGRSSVIVERSKGSFFLNSLGFNSIDPEVEGCCFLNGKLRCPCPPL